MIKEANPKETTEEIKVRFARREDVSAISKLYKTVWEEFRGQMPDALIDLGSSEKEVREQLQKTPIFIAEVEGKIVGVAYAEIVFESCRIGNFAVLEEYRQKGVGSALHQKIEEYAKEKGCHKIWLWTKPQLKEAIRFYRNRGFTEEYLLKKHFFGDDQIIMGKVLD